MQNFLLPVSYSIDSYRRSMRTTAKVPPVSIVADATLRWSIYKGKALGPPLTGEMPRPSTCRQHHGIMSPCVTP